MIRIMKAEMTMAMRLMGTPTLAAIRPEMLITDQLSQHVVPVPRDILQEETYIGKRSQAKVVGFGEAPAAAAAAAAPPPSTPPSLLDAAWKLGAIVAPVLYKSFFAGSARQVLHRSAILLIAFVVVHLLGNLRLLQGAAEFNGVAAFYASINPLVALLEVYLWLAFLAHLVLGLWLTWQTRGKLALRGGSPLSVLDRGKLFFSGLILMSFLYVHLMHFRFRDGVSLQPRTGDIHAVVLETLKPMSEAAFYFTAITLMGVHLCVVCALPRQQSLVIHSLLLSTTTRNISCKAPMQSTFAKPHVHTHPDPHRGIGDAQLCRLGQGCCQVRSQGRRQGVHGTHHTARPARGCGRYTWL